MNLTTINHLLADEDYFIRETALQIADKKATFSLESTQQIIDSIENDLADEAIIDSVREKVTAICARLPVYES